jgi:flagellar basal body-associated protein FliL
MSDLTNMFLEHIWTTVITSIALLGLIFLTWSKYTRSLLGKDFWVVMPFVGKMAAWKSMTEGTGDHVLEVPHNAGYVARTLTVPAEVELFNYYEDGLEKTSREAFLNAREYLKISGQNGRKPMSSVLWVILGVLTVAEAIGTGLLLAPLLSEAITPTMAMGAGTAIALVIAIVAVRFTHAAGEDMFANTLLSKVRSSFKQNQGFRGADGKRSGDFVQSVGPEDDQSRDVNLEPAARLAARIGATSLPSMQARRMNIVLAIVFIVLFAVGTTAYRHYMFNREQDRAASAPAASAGAASADFQNMFAQGGNATQPMPDEVAEAAKKSSLRAKEAVDQDSSMANDAGIMILALIYVFTQLLGLLTGYKYSFFNEDGKKAYRKTLGQLGYDDFLRVAVRPVAQRAQMRLGQLRAKLSSANPGYGDRMKPFDFMVAYHESLAEDERKADAVREAAAQRTAARSTAATPLASVETTPVRATTLQTSTGAAQPDAPVLEALAKEIAAIADREARQRLAVELIGRHKLDRDQQRTLVSIVKQLQEQSTIDPDLLESL